MKLSILVTVYNEIRYIKLLTEKLIDCFKNEDVEYIFINDGSTDGSKEWLENFSKNNSDYQIKFININTNKGKGMALREGLKHSIGDYILFQDSDLELDPQDSYEMYKIIKNDSKIQCLFGTRYLSGKLKRNRNFINEIVGRLNSIIFNFLFHQSVSDVHCGTKIISKQIKDKINLTINDFGFEIDLATQIVKNNFDVFEYGISYFARTVDEGKKITWIDGLKSHYYLFKTRFVDNSISTQFSIFFSVLYMIYIGSFFGLGTGKILMIILTIIIGLFIGLHRKIASSSIIYIMCFIGSLFSKGNGKIYTVLIAFIIGIYLSKKFSEVIQKNTKNKFINFFV